MKQGIDRGVYDNPLFSHLSPNIDEGGRIEAILELLPLWRGICVDPASCFRLTLLHIGLLHLGLLPLRWRMEWIEVGFGRTPEPKGRPQIRLIGQLQRRDCEKIVLVRRRVLARLMAAVCKKTE